jgi:hypothetical protein
MESISARKSTCERSIAREYEPKLGISNGCRCTAAGTCRLPLRRAAFFLWFSLDIAPSNYSHMDITHKSFIGWSQLKLSLITWKTIAFPDLQSDYRMKRFISIERVRFPAIIKIDSNRPTLFSRIHPLPITHC